MAKPYKIKRHKRIYRRSAGSIVLRVLVIVISIALLFGIGWTLFVPVSNWISNRQNQTDEAPMDSSENQNISEDSNASAEAVPGESSSSQTPVSQSALTKKTAVLPAKAAADPELLAAALEKAKAAGYDSVMLELKDITGAVNYPIVINGINNVGLLSESTFDLNSTVAQIKAAGLTPVASLYTFRDNRYPSINKDAATIYEGGEFLWVDNDPNKGGKPWLNPFSPQAQDYIRKIVDDACNAGFQMIVLDGVQFPEGYSLDKIDYGPHAGDDKNAFLKDYAANMVQYAAQKGVELTTRLAAPSMLGVPSPMYFGGADTIAQSGAVVDITPSLFKDGIQNEQITIISPVIDLYNTMKTVTSAISQKLNQTELLCYINASGVESSDLEACIRGAADSNISRCIINDPAIYA